MNQQAKNKRKFPYVAVILWVTLALVVAVLGHSLLDTLGVYGMTKAGKSQNIVLSENHMDVYRYHVAQNQLYYQYMYVQYGMMQDPTGGLIKSMSADDYINYMTPLTVQSGDYDELAYEYGEQYLTYCEGAKAEKLYDGYKTEVAADIDTYVQTLKDAAKANNVTFSGYLTKFMGNGVSEKDVRTAMEYYYIGAKYAEKLTDEFSAAVTDEQKTAYRDEHKADFFRTSYYSYKLVSADMVETVKNCKTIDEVKTAIVDYFMATKFEDNYKTNITDKSIADSSKDQTKADIRTTLLAQAGVGDNKAVFTSADTDEYKKAAYAIVKAIYSSVSTETSKLNSTAEAYYVNLNPTKADGSADTEAAAALTDLQKWLFANEGKDRVTGDYKLITTESTTSGSSSSSTTTSTTHTWYLIDKTMFLDEDRTRNLHYIELTDDAADVANGKKAQQKADEFHAAMADVPVADRVAKFKELVAQYAPGASTELIENMSKDTVSSTSSELAEWLFAEARVDGDLSNVFLRKTDTNDKDKITGCIIAIYMGENDMNWKVNAEQAIAGEKLTEWYEKAVKDFKVEMDYTPAETTAAQ